MFAHNHNTPCVAPFRIISAEVAPGAIQKVYPEEIVTKDSLALFRLGELCNHRCLMCPMTGDPDLWLFTTQELLSRADHLADLGFRQVVVTGGEPSIHPDYRAVVTRIFERGMVWDINTNATGFSDIEEAHFALEHGLRRAVVSLHSHLTSVSQAVSAGADGAHEKTISGIGNLIAAGAAPEINCVISRSNLDHLDGLIRYCATELNGISGLKLVLPLRMGRGATWQGTRVRYTQLRPLLPELRSIATAIDLPLQFELIPNCVVGDPLADNRGRLAFGETHYLEDYSGRIVRTIASIDAAWSLYREDCQRCESFARCPGVHRSYFNEEGLDEIGWREP